MTTRPLAELVHRDDRRLHGLAAAAEDLDEVGVRLRLIDAGGAAVPVVARWSGLYNELDAQGWN